MAPGANCGVVAASEAMGIEQAARTGSMILKVWINTYSVWSFAGQAQDASSKTSLHFWELAYNNSPTETENKGKNPMKEDKHDQPGPSNESKGRREFLKLGTTGVVVGLAACSTPPLVSLNPAGESPANGTDTGDQASAEKAIPDLGNLLDPQTAGSENWQEPWTWRPADWPDAILDLNVSRNQSPGASTSPGNPTPAIFSYNGTSPGPTIRVRQDATLKLRVRNLMGLNEGEHPVGPAPDMFEFVDDVRMDICSLVAEQVTGEDPENPPRCRENLYPEQVLQRVPFETRPGWNLGGHINGEHGGHTTNIHTHGLHVSPGANPDGSHSDNIFLRIIPRADWQARLEALGEGADLLADHEHVGQLDYTFQLTTRRDGQQMPHPPGTHWYHPHSHGSTHHQVSSGMAGFLLVEGDVDQAINRAMTGEDWPDPEVPTGPHDYRERLMLIQRVLVNSFDTDAGARKRNLKFPPQFAINGVKSPSLMRMRPGAVERWRVLNGSVDGAGTKRFMVLEGQFVQRDNRIWRVASKMLEGETDQDGNPVKKRWLEPVSEQDFEDAKVDLQQLSFDGITLVTEENGKAVHRIRDLSKQNAGTANPFARKPLPGENPFRSGLEAFEAVFRDGDSLRRSFVRPNELYLTNANRADIFFKAPMDAADKVYTVLAREAHIHTDTLQQSHQRQITRPEFQAFRPLFDVVVAWVHVNGKPVEGDDFDIQSLNEHLPPVPPLLQPIHENELVIPAGEAAQTGAKAGSRRCRTLSYSGTGGVDFPLIPVPDGFAEKYPQYENVLWGTSDGVQFLMPNHTRTMGINPDFDLLSNPEPGPARKFSAHDHNHPVMLLNTAEEWTVYNNSLMLWAHTDRERFPQPGSYSLHFESYPMSRAEGQRRFAEDPEFNITVKGVDHPFHIHVNPMWVLRIDVPDENGKLHNILPQPCWMDTAAIPRNGGRIVFRSRFEDYPGKWINHCHILLHEDNGMMQMVECTDDPSKVNYRTRDRVASHGMGGDEVSRIYPQPSLELMYRQNLSFIDPNELGYQEYPGFELDIPVPDKS
jgi:FtsP/CotA-like multicopper oxidase with cupredoxin domain